MIAYEYFGSTLLSWCTSQKASFSEGSETRLKMSLCNDFSRGAVDCGHWPLALWRGRTAAVELRGVKQLCWYFMYLVSTVKALSLCPVEYRKKTRLITLLPDQSALKRQRTSRLYPLAPESNRRCLSLFLNLIAGPVMPYSSWHSFLRLFPPAGSLP